jgi:hypothetical protein
VVLRPLPAAALVVRRKYLTVVPRPMPAVPRMYLIMCTGRYPRCRSLCVACTWPCCQGRCLRPLFCGAVDADLNSWLAPAARSAKADAVPHRNGTISLGQSCRVEISEQGPLDYRGEMETSCARVLMQS